MKNTNFWIGNGLLALALVILVFMGTLSQMFGIGAVVVWMIVAAAGTYFIMKSYPLQTSVKRINAAPSAPNNLPPRVKLRR